MRYMVFIKMLLLRGMAINGPYEGPVGTFTQGLTFKKFE